MPSGQPGDKFNYNNSGYVLLAMIIEKYSDKSFWGFLQKYIFPP
ncbi:MAG: hypothetical protein COA42_23870 [Alteromonadaceae bacterium]|nr:MAG: hypothetical protein COA42_23870 [Alteromonadaceae bacterium]